MNPSRPLAMLALVALVTICGCASTTLDAQWRDPQVPGNYLRGARVLVTCEAGDLTLKKICEDQLVAELTARGATTVLTLEGSGQDARAQINFPRHGQKWLALSVAKLTPVT